MGWAAEIERRIREPDNPPVAVRLARESISASRAGSGNPVARAAAADQ